MMSWRGEETSSTLVSVSLMRWKVFKCIFIFHFTQTNPSKVLPQFRSFWRTMSECWDGKWISGSGKSSIYFARLAHIHYLSRCVYYLIQLPGNNHHIKVPDKTAVEKSSALNLWVSSSDSVEPAANTSPAHTHIYCAVWGIVTDRCWPRPLVNDMWTAQQSSGASRKLTPSSLNMLFCGD